MNDSDKRDEATGQAAHLRETAAMMQAAGAAPLGTLLAMGALIGHMLEQVRDNMVELGELTREEAAKRADYVERDVGQLLAVRDLSLFQRFVKLCAARTGQLLNLSALANDCGISHTTAREWLTVLEASYLVFRMPPYHRNFGKRLVKTPKLYFLDTGLAAALLGIRDAATLNLHPLRGALFETLVVGELIKQRFNDGKPAELYFWRDNTGNEVDVVFEVGTELQAVEIKSGATLVRDWLKGIAKWQSLAGAEARSPWLIYGGADAYQRDGVQVIPWSALGG